MTPFYLALGDSLSIDLYPRWDLQERGRVGPAEAPAVGAASLFYRNHDELWPEFEGRDLVTLEPGLEKVDACMDGATIAHTAELQLPRVPAEVREGTRVATLTAGGNDLLGGLFDPDGGPERATEQAITRYRGLVERLLEVLPAAALLVATVYDPTDGSGHLPGVSDKLGPLPLPLLDRFNDAVRELAATRDRLRLADVHRHFLGHGLSTSPEACWFWRTSPIEPGSLGASEIRRLWLDGWHAS